MCHPLALERLADARRADGDVDPLAAAIALATHHTPTLKPDHLRRQIDRFAGDVRHLLAHESPPAAAVNHVLFDRHGFNGNRESYSDPCNSYLDCVLQRRRGLPILLSLLWVETARRAGVAAHGIGLPGHFIVALELEEHPSARAYLDPFHRGATLTLEDCQRVSLAAGVAWHDEFLEPVTGTQWAIRMLNNLRNAYGELHDLANVAAVLEQLLLLDPRNVMRERELQAIYARLGGDVTRNN